MLAIEAEKRNRSAAGRVGQNNDCDTESDSGSDEADLQQIMCIFSTRNTSRQVERFSPL